MNPPRIPAGIQLSAHFPPSEGYKGANTSVSDVGRIGIPFVGVGELGPKRAALQLIEQAAYQAAESYGKGSKALRRANQLT